MVLCYSFVEGSHKEGICNKKIHRQTGKLLFKKIHIYMGILILTLQRGLRSDKV
jgi:hypothetical protein